MRNTIIDKVRCWLRKCEHVYIHNTAEGIGGKCVRCGKVYGWVSAAELREYGAKRIEWLEARRKARDNESVVHKE